MLGKDGVTELAVYICVGQLVGTCTVPAKTHAQNRPGRGQAAAGAVMTQKCELLITAQAYLKVALADASWEIVKSTLHIHSCFLHIHFLLTSAN